METFYASAIRRRLRRRRLDPGHLAAVLQRRGGDQQLGGLHRPAVFGIVTLLLFIPIFPFFPEAAEVGQRVGGRRRTRPVGRRRAAGGTPANEHRRPALQTAAKAGPASYIVQIN